MELVGNEFKDEKEAIVVATSIESGNTHVSFESDDGKIIVFEYIPDNYPAAVMYACSTAEEYFGTIKEVEWIKDNMEVSSRYEEVKDRIVREDEDEEG